LIGDEYGAGPDSIDGLGEDKVSRIEIDLEIFPGKVEFDDAVTRIGVERVLLELMSKVGCGGCGEETGYQ